MFSINTKFKTMNAFDLYRHLLVVVIIACISACSSSNEVEPGPASTRQEKWKADLAYFEDIYLTRSRTFPQDSLLPCKKVLRHLKANQETLTDPEIILGLSKCVAMANNGHTTIHLSRMATIPLRFYWFKDGLHIIKSDTASSIYLGSKLLAINGMPVDKVYKKLAPYLSGIPSFKKFTATHYLSSPEILSGIGLSKPNQMELRLLKGADTLSTTFTTKEMSNPTYAYESWSDLYPDWNTKDEWAYTLAKNKVLPLYLEHMDKGVFYHFLEEEQLAYFSINAMWYKEPDFKGKIGSFLKELKGKRDFDVVLDLRYYTGGNYLIPTELASQPPKIINDDQKIYLITSPMTFSAGLVTAARTKYFAKDKLVIVGEEVGDRLKFWAEGDYYKTPHFEIQIQDSKFEHDWEDNTFTFGKSFWVNNFYGVGAKHLRVDEPIKLSYKDYYQGVDPILDWIKAQ